MQKFSFAEFESFFKGQRVKCTCRASIDHRCQKNMESGKRGNLQYSELQWCSWYLEFNFNHWLISWYNNIRITKAIETFRIKFTFRHLQSATKFALLTGPARHLKRKNASVHWKMLVNQMGSWACIYVDENSAISYRHNFFFKSRGPFQEFGGGFLCRRLCW